MTQPLTAQTIAQLHAQMQATLAGPGPELAINWDTTPLMPLDTVVGQPISHAQLVAEWEAFTQIPTKKVKAKATPNENLPALMQDLYSYSALKMRKTDSMTYERGNKIKGKPFQWATTQGLVGIEIEVENIKNGVPLKAYWDTKADNSLRNRGAEFVSVPLQVKQIQLALEHLYEALCASNTPDFSNRTSVHIHVNCRDLTQDQIYNFCLLYAIFEKHFYRVAGTKRMNSIFCVPLFRTNQLSTLSNVIYGFDPSWNKYCGLNILPLVNNNLSHGYGTVEFRHLYGTNSIDTIMTWINDVMCLRKFACEITKPELLELIKSMNTTSSYMSLYSQVFSGGTQILSDKRDFEECISNIKRELFGNDYLSTLSKSDSGPYWKTMQLMGIRG